MMNTDGAVHVFADLSNLIAGAWAAAIERREREVRLAARSLLTALAENRPIASACAIANTRLGDRALERFEGAGWVLDRVEPGELSGREQYADQAMQARIFEALRVSPRSPIVVATGDGAGHAFGHGFVPLLDVAVRAGHKVEVATWTSCLNPTLERFARSRGRLRLLDGLYPYITFVEGGRPALPLPTGMRAA